METGDTEEFLNLLPYKKYVLSEMDVALIGEEVRSAESRLSTVTKIINEEKIESTLLRSLRGTALYTEMFPEASVNEDSSLSGMKRPDGSIEPSWCALARYGSDKARDRPDVKFLADFGYTAHVALAACEKTKMNKYQAEILIKASHEFTRSLFNIQHISEDELLKEPLKTLGSGIAKSLSSESELLQKWQSYLDKVIGEVNLIGEDGAVMEDMTAGLLSFSIEWFLSELGIMFPKQIDPDQLELDFGH